MMPPRIKKVRMILRNRSKIPMGRESQRMLHKSCKMQITKDQKWEPKMNYFYQLSNQRR